MSAFSDNSFEKNLKCDFPARESFREALLSDLLTMNDEGLQQAPAAEPCEKRKDAARIVKLEDADLEKLAAAEGEQRVFKNPFEE